jgi:ectoine hydroxylase-related dioxygenase (phytanoyl-CoA dioxygenase family)
MGSTLHEQIERDGFAVLTGVFDRERVAQLLAEVTQALEAQSEANGAIGAGTPYAARNLLSAWPRAGELARAPAIHAAVTELLGAGCGLVRGLFFDKPPGVSWALPWHKDMTIAVRANDLPSTNFSKPTNKAGVPHVQAPESVLASMITVRIHLDDVVEENGPLLLLPGSHKGGKMPSAAGGIRQILVSAGDVLLMRPLVMHSSGYARADTQRHRRIVHLEFASATPLPDGYQWHHFEPLDAPLAA